jgi:hypothetical protein
MLQIKNNKYKNMKKIVYAVFIGALTVLMSCKTKEVKKEVSSEVAIEVNSTSEKWITLFDGTNYDNWKGYMEDGMYDEWSIDDGAMLYTPSEEKGRDIMTKGTYTNFILSLEWKISEKGNSGIFWGVNENENNKIYHSGPEVQVLDNERHPDAFKNPKYHQAGALYDMVQPTSDVCNPAGQWNKVELKVNHKSNKGSIKLNGTLIVEFEPHGERWDALIAKSKFKNSKEFGKYQTGHLGLQDHGDKVWYKDIKIKEL